jgi:hypothetical protein
MNRKFISAGEKEGQEKSEWVTPELSRMSIEQTLTGRLDNPSEEMSGNPSGFVPGQTS